MYEGSRASSVVLAFWDAAGYEGEYQVLQYASSQNKEVHYIFPGKY